MDQWGSRAVGKCISGEVEQWGSETVGSRAVGQ